jgi:DNA processing protein
VSPPVPTWMRRGSRGWPERLEHLNEPPAGIWVWGAQRSSLPSVAVVGSRRATALGIDIARSLGCELAEAGVQVVSGMARGIDAAAHGGAIEGGGSTVAVLGCGIDVCYPPEQGKLRDAIVIQGCLISEEERLAEPIAYHFPKRNRIIAALAQAVVVVEATARSGALGTARWAADLGREVLAVPGSIRSTRSEGTNQLIRDGARPFLDITDLFESVPPLQCGARSERSPGDPPVPKLSAPLEQLLLRLGPDPVHPDDVGRLLGLSAPVVAARLSALELAGAVMSLPGGLIARRV